MIRKLDLLAVPAIIAAAFLSVQLVQAHSRPVRIDPPAGAVLTAAPAQVSGWFTQPLRRDPNWTFLRVQDAQGNVVSTGEATLSADRKQMTVGLRSGLPEGRYMVVWRTWDDNDGAIFGDCYSFFVGQAAADASVAANTRLDGGNTCPRIDVSAREATPVAGGTPQATAVPEDHAAETDDGTASSENSGVEDGGGVPVWALIVGVLGGGAVGAVGGRMLAGRP